MAETEVLCFDVYGSTHNQHSIVETLADVADVSLGVAEEMSELWVEHQIDYSMEVNTVPSAVSDAPTRTLSGERTDDQTNWYVPAIPIPMAAMATNHQREHRIPRLTTLARRPTVVSIRASYSV
jgi:hypothetical protein